MILLDTQVVIWAAGDDDRLGRAARLAIQQDGDRRVSAIMAWEIAMLVRKQRLVLGMDLDAWLTAMLNGLRIRVAPITREIAQDAGALNGSLHGDPADRLMIATARAMRVPLLTADEKILAYAEQGHVQAIDARR